jgi:uncharacterized protein (TIGR00297 family)
MYDESRPNLMTRLPLFWQSKLILLLVYPAIAADVVLQAQWWAANMPSVAGWTLGLSLLLGLAAWKAGAATPWAAAAGALLAASLAFSTAVYPYVSWRTALVPLLTLLILTTVATSMGQAQKLELGLAEELHGRSPAQVAANLGVAALLSTGAMQSLLLASAWYTNRSLNPALALTLGLAALAESAADTCSSEMGQILDEAPRLLTTLRRVEHGTDGAISPYGSLAGVAAAALVAAAGAWALGGSWKMFAIALGSGVFGFFFDSLLGATLERKGWLNNDAVNFLSTLSAALCALLLLLLLPLWTF